MKPRMPESAPVVPTITLPSTASGASVKAYARSMSASTTSQSSAPVVASTATTCASSVAMKSRSPSTATPRLFAPQQARWLGEGL